MNLHFKIMFLWDKDWWKPKIEKQNKIKNIDDLILIRNLFHLLINFAFVFKQPRAVAKMGGNRMLTDSGNL
jgi:hypothetical protein